MIQGSGLAARVRGAARCLCTVSIERSSIWTSERRRSDQEFLESDHVNGESRLNQINENNGEGLGKKFELNLLAKAMCVKDSDEVEKQSTVRLN